MASSLAVVPVLPRDEAFSVTSDFNADDHPSKVSLGVGVYRDENGKPWVLPSVQAAKKMLHEMPNWDHEYLPIQGSAPFLDAARQLLLGDYDVASSKVVSIQTISGTGANHLGAAFLGQQLKPKAVFISDPTWGNHHLIWEVAAPKVIRKTYPYYHSHTRSLDFEGMMEKLEAEAEENDVVILHACAHNPTGIDPTRAQWKALAQLFQRKKLFAFFDSAYQGFATGDVDVDAWAPRHFQKVLFQSTSSAQPQGICIAQSFSKNFGLYGERVGALHLVVPAATPLAGSLSQLSRLTRAEISNPPSFGSRIVQMILTQPELRRLWEQDLKTMATRTKRMRTLLRQEIEKQQGSGDWGHLESQIGMFSFTGLSREQVLLLRDVHHVYLMPNGRASMCGLNEGNIQYVANAIVDVLGVKNRE